MPKSKTYNCVRQGNSIGIIKKNLVQRIIVTSFNLNIHLASSGNI